MNVELATLFNTWKNSKIGSFYDSIKSTRTKSKQQQTSVPSRVL